ELGTWNLVPTSVFINVRVTPRSGNCGIRFRTRKLLRRFSERTFLGKESHAPDHSPHSRPVSTRRRVRRRRERAVVVFNTELRTASGGGDARGRDDRGESTGRTLRLRRDAATVARAVRGDRGVARRAQGAVA